jgi:glycosyltransferase involved in cell wall biosynthesis
MSPSILFVTTVPVTLEVFLAPFARHLRERDWAVDGLANGAASCARIAQDFGRLFDIGWTRSPVSFLQLPALTRRVRTIVAEGGYDLVHVHTPIAAFVTRFALRNLERSDRPIVVYTAHGFHFYRGGRPLPNRVYRWMERAAARWTDYIVTINGEDLDAARSFGTIKPDRVRLIPGIGVDPGPYAQGAVAPREAHSIRTELMIPEDAFLLLMIAEFGRVKRHEHALKALANTRNKGTVLVLAGDGPLEQRVRDRAEELGIKDRVRFAGYRRDVPALLAAADALLLASEREGLPRSMLEAMAAGVPVIGTDTRGIADLLKDGAGWIADKHDPNALAAVIDIAAGDAEERARRGFRGRELVAERYALPLIMATYEEMYREALASRV